MIYIDTDVLIHAYVVQDQHKHQEANEVIEQVNSLDTPVISTLSVQEMLYTLSRLGLSSEEVYRAYGTLSRLRPVAYDAEDLRRAVEIARHVGYRNINDCIHTAIAEPHCTELITYNHRDFDRIRNHARIDIRVL